MHKTLLALAFAALASIATAATAGSYAPVTVKLTITEQGPASFRTVKNGATEKTLTVTKTVVGNAAILLEAQRLAIMPPGSLKGWGIVLVSDANWPRLFYAYNKASGSAVRLDDILGFEPAGWIGSGKLVTPINSDVVDTGASKSIIPGTLLLDIGESSFTGSSGFTQNEKTTAPGAAGIWLPSARGSLGVFGYANGELLTGKVTTAAAKAVADVETMFPDFNED